jgi:integral membrane protein
MTPRRLFRLVAVAEAVTWALLLTGMVFKYTGVTELGVRVFGMVHGVVFIAYCLVTVLLWVDQRWSLGRLVLGLVSAVPPFMTLWFERYAERHGLVGDSWLSRPDSPTAAQRAACWLLSHHRVAVPGFLVAVAALTGVALVAGPPVG